LGQLDLNQRRRTTPARARPGEYRHRADAVVFAAAIGAVELDEEQARSLRVLLLDEAVA
jgi:hypothetical protein